MHEREVLNIDGGLNYDDDDKSLKSGDYRYALNIKTFINSKGRFNSKTNVRGNTLISYNLPHGNNKSIGTYENKNNNSLIYFIWNSFGTHSILQYFLKTNTIVPILKESLLGFDKDFLITEINLIDNKLLAWTDGNKQPRRTNIEKAIVSTNNNPIKFHIYFDIKENGLFPDGASFGLKWLDNGLPKIVNNFYMASGIENNLYAGIDQFVSAFNTNTTLKLNFTATSCGSVVEVVSKSGNNKNIEIISDTNTPVQIVYDNCYDEFIEQYINAAKEPPNCNPTAAYKKDPKRKTNLVQNKVFQFALRYIYDDGDKSTLSPYSPISIINGHGCSSNTDVINPYNYIEIDFNDDRLKDRKFLCIIKNIDLFVREHNIGKWKKITTLGHENFGIKNNIFRFYNDGIYNEISDLESITLYSNIPLLANAQEVIDGRMAYGDTTEGFNKPCIDASISVSYDDVIQEETYKISGSIRIKNFFANDSKFRNYQPIHDYGNGAVFGGFGKKSIAQNIEDCNQYIPLGGFVVFLEGTDYYGISKQRAGECVSSGVYTSKNQSLFTCIHKKNCSKYRNENCKIIHDIKKGNVYSLFEISNVPNGTYLLRVASHLTTESDLASKTRAYQRTSTNMLSCGVAGRAECIVTVNNGNVSIGEITIADLTDPRLGTSTQVITGYVTDKDVTLPPSPTVADYMGDKRIELAQVVMTGGSLWNGNSASMGATDHNGYFFATISSFAGTGSSSIYTIRSNMHELNPAYFDFNTGLPTSATVTNNNAIHLICRNTNDNVSNYSRTVLQGLVTDNDGNPIEGINVTTTRGDRQTTDTNGIFKLIVYGFIGNRTDKLIFSVFDNCTALFTPQIINYSLNIDSTHYNYNKTYNLPSGVVAILPQASRLSFKRGSDLQFGVVYYDNIMRSCSVVTEEQLKTHINFYTEPKEDGTFYPYGIPHLSWSIRSTPPNWATHWQWVRLLNTQTNFYLQFGAKTITYIDKNGSQSNFNDGEFIKIDLENIIDYKKDFPNSQLGYTWSKGDRVRFIKKNKSTFFEDYYDLEIVNDLVDTNNTLTSIIVRNNFEMGKINSGCLFEIYTPKLNVEKQLWYEFGECFEVGTTNDGIKYHKGLTQDQYPSDPYNIPATGVFMGGDAYYRTRRIPVTGGSILYYIDDPSISDFYDSKDQSIGRINIINNDEKQIQRTNAVVLSENYITDTKINGLAMFIASNYVTTEKSFGAITKIKVVGDSVALIICEHKVHPFYIGKATIKDAKNTKLLTIADDILNSGHWLLGDYGTQNPESVEIYDDNVRFYDHFQGCEIRYSSNGLHKISDNKMKSFFKETSDIYKQYGVLPKVIAGFDSYYYQRLITFIDSNLDSIIANPPTLSFNESKNNYESFYSFIPEYYGKVGDVLITFKNGQLWKHDNNLQRNNFYGTQYQSKIRLVTKESNKIKIFSNIAIDSTHAWECNPITTPPNANLPNGQLSIVKSSKFVKKEGVWYSEFNMDASTPYVSDPLVNGRPLRAKVVDVTILNDNTEEVVLNSVEIYSFNSEKS